jgi:hypothetical protein
MKKIYLMAALCAGTMTVFSQSVESAREKLNDPQTVENAAKADTSLIDKKSMTADKKKKKPRREASRKQCSRMKS